MYLPTETSKKLYQQAHIVFSKDVRGISLEREGSCEFLFIHTDGRTILVQEILDSVIKGNEVSVIKNGEKKILNLNTFTLK